ncbi:hypothetical protein [Methylobacterium nodulans]|uniref:Response regulator receiver protein n=1 Tax=Methylobacterium nodulans (strain LMG 21967 / CNCM I-2342 / ORS 2060) TaxID=460265 RepID=B8IVD3_METNO|nr:conserved hypothetical protein [Methylobacterium nodulans ORS 2060]
MQENHAESQPVVLIAEPQALPGMWLEDLLTDAGCTISGPYGTCADAVESLGRTRPSVAIVSVDLNQGPCFPLARVLRQRGIPFALIAGSVPVPRTFTDVPVLDRLIDKRTVMQTIAGLAPGHCRAA